MKAHQAFYDAKVRGYMDQMRLIHVRGGLAQEDRKRKTEKPAKERKSRAKRGKDDNLKTAGDAEPTEDEVYKVTQ